MMIEFNWKAFWVGSLTSLVLLLNSPIFKRFAPKRYVSYFVISLTSWATLIHYYFTLNDKGGLACKPYQLNMPKM